MKNINKNHIRVSKKSKGFTLVELLVTVAIISIILLIGYISYISIINNSKDKLTQKMESKLKETAANIAKELDDSKWGTIVTDSTSGNYNEDIVKLIPNSSNDKHVMTCISVQDMIDKGYYKEKEIKKNNIELETYIIVVKNTTNKTIVNEEIDQNNICQNMSPDNLEADNYPITFDYEDKCTNAPAVVPITYQNASELTHVFKITDSENRNSKDGIATTTETIFACGTGEKDSSECTELNDDTNDILPNTWYKITTSEIEITIKRNSTITAKTYNPEEIETIKTFSIKKIYNTKPEISIISDDKIKSGFNQGPHNKSFWLHISSPKAKNECGILEYKYKTKNKDDETPLISEDNRSRLKVTVTGKNECKTIEIIATDKAGNEGYIDYAYCIGNDNTPPIINYKAYLEDNSEYTSGTWTNQTVYTKITATDEESKIANIQYKIGTEEWQDIENFDAIEEKELEKTWSIPTNSFEEKTITFKACNGYGNCTETQPLELKQDTILPTLNITGTNNLASNQTITATCNDVNSQISSYTYVGPSNSSTTTNLTEKKESISISKTESSNGTVSLICKDEAGNENKIEKKLYQTVLMVNKGSTDYNSIITLEGNSFNLPTPTTSKGYNLIDINWIKSSDESQIEQNSTYTPTSSDTLTIAAVPNKLYIKYNVDGGSILEQTTNSDGTINYWKINSQVNTDEYDNVIGRTRDKVNNNESYYNIIEYGETRDLSNYNNKNFMYITKKDANGYNLIGLKGQEWLCTDGCDEDKRLTAYSQITEYSPEDFCDISEKDCTVTLKVNWVETANVIMSFGTNNQKSKQSGTLNAETLENDSSVTLQKFDNIYEDTNFLCSRHPSTGEVYCRKVTGTCKYDESSLKVTKSKVTGKVTGCKLEDGTTNIEFEWILKDNRPTIIWNFKNANPSEDEDNIKMYYNDRYIYTKFSDFSEGKYDLSGGGVLDKNYDGREIVDGGLRMFQFELNKTTKKEVTISKTDNLEKPSYKFEGTNSITINIYMPMMWPPNVNVFVDGYPGNLGLLHLNSNLICNNNAANSSYTCNVSLAKNNFYDTQTDTQYPESSSKYCTNLNNCGRILESKVGTTIHWELPSDGLQEVNKITKVSYNSAGNFTTFDNEMAGNKCSNEDSSTNNDCSNTGSISINSSGYRVIRIRATGPGGTSDGYIYMAIEDSVLINGNQTNNASVSSTENNIYYITTCTSDTCNYTYKNGIAEIGTIKKSYLITELRTASIAKANNSSLAYAFVKPGMTSSSQEVNLFIGVVETQKINSSYPLYRTDSIYTSASGRKWRKLFFPETTGNNIITSFKLSYYAYSTGNIESFTLNNTKYYYGWIDTDYVS